MGLINFLKSKFNKNKALPEVNNERYADIQNSMNRYKVGYVPKINTLDSALDDYLQALLNRSRQGLEYDSYNALVSLGTKMDKSPGKNLGNESKFLKKIREKQYDSQSDFSCIMQPFQTKDGRLSKAWIQLMSGYGPDGIEEEDVKKRIYLNCKRKNISSLAMELYKELGNSKYAFKFMSDDNAKEWDNSAAIVFYLSDDPNELENIVRTIERTRMKNPKLFEGTENTNPFMKTYSGYIGIAPQPDSCFVDLRGRAFGIDRSYNTLLAYALEDSFTHSMQETIAKDYNLSLKFGGDICMDKNKLVRDGLEDIIKTPGLYNILKYSMKKDLEELSRKNPKLDIIGINNSKSRTIENR